MHSDMDEHPSTEEAGVYIRRYMPFEEALREGKKEENSENF